MLPHLRRANPLLPTAYCLRNREHAMDLGLSEAQELLRRSAREFFERECPLSRVREIQESDGGFSRELWDRIARLGWLGLLVDEQHGGSGGDLTDAAILLEEVGRALAPVPL